MPHLVIDCSQNVLSLKSFEEVMQTVYDAANSTNLFAKGDIKVRINPFEYFNVGNSKDDFIHVFAHIMGGRNTNQKADLSKKIISSLKRLLPEISIISINIMEFEKTTYCNRTMV